jgi:hypothetical protein
MNAPPPPPPPSLIRAGTAANSIIINGVPHVYNQSGVLVQKAGRRRTIRRRSRKQRRNTRQRR